MTLAQEKAANAAIKRSYHTGFRTGRAQKPTGISPFIFASILLLLVGISLSVHQITAQPQPEQHACASISR